MGSTFFLGFFCPNLLLVFLSLLFLGTYSIFFRECWDFLWIFLIFYVPYFGLLACDHGNSFISLDE